MRGRKRRLKTMHSTLWSTYAKLKTRTEQAEDDHWYAHKHSCPRPEMRSFGKPWEHWLVLHDTLKVALREAERNN